MRGALDTLDTPMVERALDVGLRITGMEAALLSEFREGDQVVRAASGAFEPLLISIGQRVRLEDGYCQRSLDGRTQWRVPDTREDPATRDLELTAIVGVRAYVSVPVRFPDGRLYGSLCCVEGVPRTDIDDGALELLGGLAALLGHQLHADHLGRRVARQRDELLESVTHDLRTPLMALRFIGEDLVARTTDPADAGLQVQREAARVLSMVEDILLVTRQRAGTAFLQARPTDLVQLVREAAESAGQAAVDDRHPIALRLPDCALVAAVDANRILRALQNLLDNARIYSPDGGPIELTVRQDGTTALLLVRDAGMGIEPDDLPQLTDRFFRSDRAVAAGIVGTGLGLTTVQAVADLHEGTLSVESEVGTGSTFLLRLPLRSRAVR